MYKVVLKYVAYDRVLEDDDERTFESRSEAEEYGQEWVGLHMAGALAMDSGDDGLDHWDEVEYEVIEI